jgi:trypsin-like peptidase
MYYVRLISFGIFFSLVSLVSLHAATIDELARTVVYLLERPKAPIGMGIMHDVSVTQGTGFLVSYNNKIYLVTAAHVAREMSGEESQVFFNTSSGKQQSLTLKQLKDSIPNSRWFFHESADIAIHPFSLAKNSEYMFISEKLFVSKDETVPLGTKASILGFPLGLGTIGYLTPILRDTEVASWKLRMEDPNIRPDVDVIILADPLADGYSGSPVFIYPVVRSHENGISTPSQPKLLGVVIDTLYDKTGGKMSCIVPVSYLLDIFNSDEFKKYEKSP